jgi:hypothetical protein
VAFSTSGLEEQIRRSSRYRVVNIFIDTLTLTTGGTFQQLYASPKYARKVTIQNLTTQAATIVTISSELGTSKGQNATAAKSFMIPAGSGAGVGSTVFFQAGNDADPDNLLDLSKLYWTATNANDQIAVVLEVIAEKLY